MNFLQNNKYGRNAQRLGSIQSTFIKKKIIKIITKRNKFNHGNVATILGIKHNLNYTNRHIFNLPLTVETYASDGYIRVSKVDYQYDGPGSTLQNAPGVVMHAAASDPYTTDPKDFCSGDPACIAGGVGRSPYPFIYDAKNPKYVVTPAAIIPMDPNFRWPEIYQMNIGFEQQLANGFMFAGSYVASLGRKLPNQWDLNYPQFNLTSAGASARADASGPTIAHAAASSRAARGRHEDVRNGGFVGVMVGRSTGAGRL